MIHTSLLRPLFLLLCSALPLLVSGVTEKYRTMWRENPSTSMVIGWNQKSGTSPVVYLGEVDQGQEYSRYQFSKKPDAVVAMRGMNNHFARLRGLKPNTVYYFVIRDSEGISRRFSFKTAPNNSSERLSIIAGGDSRNHRDIRKQANKLVGKLRPHVVLFNGDMTDRDSAPEWQTWLDDWQLTIADDGRITPILVARGNHEKPDAIVALFDLPKAEAYYALNMGGNLLRIYTLNSMIPAGGNQRNWLERDLNNNASTTWKIAQYHISIRPHTAKKPENGDQYSNWASLFYGFNVNLAIESDAHVVKTTWPIRPSNEAGSAEGFIRDDYKGTVFVGEGGWGAPLRASNDNKPWTRNSASFNQFNWIFVSAEQIEVRTVNIANSTSTQAVDPNNIFRPPMGLSIWNPSNGDVIVIQKPGAQMLAQAEQAPAPKPAAPAPQNAFSEGTVVATRLPGFAMQTFQRIRAEVTFSTANEPASMGYELQRSHDGGKNYVTIAEFKGFGKSINQYQHSDDAGEPTARYRLRRIFPNGESDCYLPTGDLEEDLGNYDRLPLLVPDRASETLKVAYGLDFRANVHIRLINMSLREVVGIELPNQAPGKFLKSIDLSAVPRGPYLVVIRANSIPLRRFRVQK